MKREEMIKKRVFWLGLVAGCYFLALIFRLLYLQVLNQGEFTEHAKALWSRNLPIEGQRGRMVAKRRALTVASFLAYANSTINNSRYQGGFHVCHTSKKLSKKKIGKTKVFWSSSLASVYSLQKI